MDELLEHHRRMLEMSKQGYKIKELAEMFGMSMRSVYDMRARLRRKGYNLDHPYMPRKPSPLEQKHRPVSGSVLKASLNQMDDDTQLWVMNSIPEGATLAEFAVACMISERERELDDE